MQKFEFDPTKYQNELIGIIDDLLLLDSLTQSKLMQVLRKHPRDKNKVFRKDHLVSGIDLLITQGVKGVRLDKLQELKRKISKKPTRTISGVTTVTVLTKPFPCPGRCIFCPNDIRMPKSYIANEPGAQRALANRFDPYSQVYNRIQAYKNNGHPTDKIELLVLGGTWSSYRANYKRWFVKECFKAMNDFENSPTLPQALSKLQHWDGKVDSLNETMRQKLGDRPYNQLIASREYKEIFDEFVAGEVETSWQDLEREQERNSHTKCRCVGLVLETRPDAVTVAEVLNMRRLGATKIQLGVQTLDDEISALNKRGENKKDVIEAFRLLRHAGFKIHAHIMPNLYGATKEKDLQTYVELFQSPNFKPDELKIYPTSVIKYTELHKLYKSGDYTPYKTSELVDLISECVSITPEYCRLTRIIRDIPSTEIEGGNKITNLREVVENKLKVEGIRDNNIRAREIKSERVSMKDLNLDYIDYQTIETKEYFLQFVTKERKIAGFLRLSLPILTDSHNFLKSSTKRKIFSKKTNNPITPELNNCAIIREVHVYGPSLELSRDSEGEAQHLGLGTILIDKAKKIAKQNGYSKLAVISSIGTREYYKNRGFKLRGLYQVATLK